MDDRAELGRAGEKGAARFLRGKGYRIVTRNYRCPCGEIDLIALDDKVVVFVEVKTRRAADHADPEQNVTPAKQQRITRSAEFFLRQTGSDDRLCRFDIIAITLSDAKKMDIEHFMDAFSLSG
ncbi:MAG: YraN family protein [Planctomycetota bacterium]|nr:MAG: YraN family protein [Planctomycetota bacterium]